jgi:hypothetical protein
MGVETMLIEEIRATGTEESRRKVLIEAVGGLEKKISEVKKNQSVSFDIITDCKI